MHLVTRHAPTRYLLIGLLAACGNGAPDAPGEGAGAAQDSVADAPAVAVDPSVSLACVKQREDMERVSAYDSTTMVLGGQLRATICYSRPERRDREIFGQLVPYGTLWRTGANEPTTLHIPFAAEIAGIRVEPGHVALYTIPMEEGPWTIVVTRATEQWGHESAYTPEVEAQEAGRGQAPAERLDTPVENFTIRWESGAEHAGTIVLEWELTRVRIPFRAMP
jgi:hypothetical protein